MTVRHDDVAGFIATIEAEEAGRKVAKIKQTWTGDAAVKVAPGNGHKLAAAIRAGSPKSWDHGNISSGNSWAGVSTSYTAKGANADDAEKLIRRIAAKENITILGDVAIDTHGITVVGEPTPDA